MLQQSLRRSHSDWSTPSIALGFVKDAEPSEWPIASTQSTTLIAGDAPLPESFAPQNPQLCMQDYRAGLKPLSRRRSTPQRPATGANFSKKAILSERVASGIALLRDKIALVRRPPTHYSPALGTDGIRQRRHSAAAVAGGGGPALTSTVGNHVQQRGDVAPPPTHVRAFGWIAALCARAASVTTAHVLPWVGLGGASDLQQPAIDDGRAPAATLLLVNEMPVPGHCRFVGPCGYNLVFVLTSLPYESLTTHSQNRSSRFYPCPEGPHGLRCGWGRGDTLPLGVPAAGVRRQLVTGPAPG